MQLYDIIHVLPTLRSHHNIPLLYILGEEVAREDVREWHVYARILRVEGVRGRMGGRGGEMMRDHDVDFRGEDEVELWFC